MSTLLLLASSSIRRNVSVNSDNEVKYSFIFENTDKNSWENGYTENWTHLFLKEYPYTSLREGQVFQLKDGIHDNETYKVRVINQGYTFGIGKYYKVWFRKNI